MTHEFVAKALESARQLDAWLAANYPHREQDIAVAALDTLKQLHTDRAKIWEQGFDAGELDIMQHEASNWENECVKNPYSPEDEK